MEWPLPRLAQTWTGGGADNNWGTSGNWNPAGFPVNNGTAILTFAGSIRLSPIVNVPYSINSLTFNAGAGAFSIGGSQLSVAGPGITNNSASAETITAAIALTANTSLNTSAGTLNINGAFLPGVGLTQVNGTSNVAFRGVVSGSGEIRKNSSGMLSFIGSASNTFTGLVNVKDGLVVMNTTGQSIGGNLTIGDSTGAALSASVRLDQGSQLSGATTALTVNSDGLLNLNNFNDSVGSIALNGGTINSGTGTLTNLGGITVTGSGTISGNLSFGGSLANIAVASGNLNLTANMSNGVINLTGLGQTTLSGNSTYAGGTTVTGTVLGIASDTALGTGLLDMTQTLFGNVDSAPHTLSNTVAFSSANEISNFGTLTLNGPLVFAPGAAVQIVSGTLNANNSTPIDGLIDVEGATLNAANLGDLAAGKSDHRRSCGDDVWRDGNQQWIVFRLWRHV